MRSWRRRCARGSCRVDERVPVSWYQGSSIESSSASAAMAARRCSLLSARQLRPMRARAPVMRCPGRPRRRGSRSAAPFLLAIVCGAGTDTSRNRGDCWTRRRRHASLPSCPVHIPLVARMLALGALALVAAAAAVILFVRGAEPPGPGSARSLRGRLDTWRRSRRRGVDQRSEGRRRRAGGQPPRPRRRPRPGERDGRRQGDDTARATVLHALGRARDRRRGATTRASRCSAATGTGRSSGRPRWSIRA